jgi:hypothetical protein
MNGFEEIYLLIRDGESKRILIQEYYLIFSDFQSNKEQTCLQDNCLMFSLLKWKTSIVP